jgi:outer membrane protein assembly factor BamE (lipoprotein component of BamABCDE complex)
MSLISCTTVDNPALLEEERLQQIRLGETTKAQVEALLGRPMTMSQTLIDGGQIETWIYNYGRAETNPLLFVPIIGLGVAISGNGITAEGRSLIVGFAPNGTVRTLTRSKSQYGAPSAQPEDQNRPLAHGIND